MIPRTVRRGLVVLLLLILLITLNLVLAGLMTETDEDKMDTRRSIEHRILVIGKSGNGKSSLCNMLCDSPRFETGRGLAVTTRTAQVYDVHRYGYQMRVVDTPDVTNLNMSPLEMEEEVLRWRTFTHPYPTVILLAVRCDVRYTAEEHAIYRHIQKLWGDNSMVERLVVAFTFGDRQDTDLDDELRTVCPELKNVLRDASHRYIMFTNKGPAQEREAQVQRLMTLVDRSLTQVEPGYKSSTTKYLSPRALGVLCFILGLCVVASWIADKSRNTIGGFGLLCLVAGLAALFVRFKEKI